MAIKKNVEVEKSVDGTVMEVNAEVVEVERLGRPYLVEGIQKKVRATGRAIPKTLTEIVVIAMEELIQEALGNGKEILLPGFGKYSVKVVSRREAKKIGTSGPMAIAKHVEIRFKPGAGLKKAVNAIHIDGKK